MDSCLYYSIFSVKDLDGIPFCHQFQPARVKSRGTVTRKLSGIGFQADRLHRFDWRRLGSGLPLPGPPHPNRLSEIAALGSPCELLLRCSCLIYLITTTGPKPHTRVPKLREPAFFMKNAPEGPKLSGGRAQPAPRAGSDAADMARRQPSCHI